MTLIDLTRKLQNYIHDNPEPSKISDVEIKKIYQDLIDCLWDHNHLYYIDSAPIISDFEYDQLFAYLKKIEEDFPYLISWNSPTQKLVNQIQDWFNKWTHKAPLLSLENSYNATDLIERAERAKKVWEKEWIDTNFRYLVEPKFDWLSIELIYEDWIFVQGITRWDWYIWEDVTANVKTIKSIPQKLKIQIPWICSFRWEVLIWKDELEKINKERESKWETAYANTRNLASGSLKQLDPNITAQRNLLCCTYEIIYSEQQITNSLEELGLPVHPRHKEFDTIQQVVELCENPETKELLKQENIDFDWLVIKIIWQENRNKLGTTAHHPRRWIAYKFPAEQISTQIESVDFQVWRTGIITPVANLVPVQLSWVTISRVSLHNFDFIKEKDIHFKDFVWIQRSGEVIPYITSVIKESRTDENLISAPLFCPSCNWPITNIDIHYYCKNTNCPAQIKEKIIRFVSKDCMDIEWIWDSIVDILVEHNIISNVADLYKLLDFETERVVRRFPWFADKKVSEIKSQLTESKSKDFWRLLNGLGIPWIWKKTAKDICNWIAQKLNWNTTLQDITKYLTDQEFLTWIYWVGEKIIEWIIQYRQDNQELLKQLENLWLNFNCYQETKQDSDAKHFCITWSFEASRPEIIAEMEKNWFIFDSNPTKSTNIMFIWEKPGNKATKAEELWIKIYNSRDKIIQEFPFLKDIQPKVEQKWPMQVWLF